MGNINIKDIAKLSGVGIATVSRVLNQTGYVSEKTRKKVMDVINQYNYIPNNNARNLKLTQSENIALFVKYISNPFFEKMIEIIQQEVASRGYPLLIQNVDENSDEFPRWCRSPKGWRQTRPRHPRRSHSQLTPCSTWSTTTGQAMRQ